MFTGLVEEKGKVVSARTDRGGLELQVEASFVGDLQIGDSVATAGVCLTVTQLSDRCFTTQVMPQSLGLTTLNQLKVGHEVNLERAMRADTRLGGHLVSGHIDGKGRVQQLQRTDPWVTLRISISPELAAQVAWKGSITVDGVSLTVSGVGDTWFEVSLIPQTLKETTLGTIKEGDEVNLETDLLAKYVARLMETRK